MTKPATIYIIDDDVVYQFALKRMLNDDETPYNVKSFEDGEEAIEFLEQNIDSEENLPDIILLDINMPIMDGWQFLEEYDLVKDKISIKPTIYLVSSSVDPADLEKAKGIEEVADYLIKPLSNKKLKEVLQASENNT